MADNRATVEITASSRNLDARLRDALNKFVTFAGNVDKTAKKHAGGGAMASFLGNFGSSIATRGLDTIRDAGANVLDFERKMTRLQIASDRTTAEMIPFRNAVRAASDETGQSRDDILDAASTYVALTGDMKGAEAQTREFARVATASGASIQDVAAAGVAMQQALQLDPSQMDAAFSSMIVQGKAGAIELKDVASEMSSVAPQFAKFAGGTGIAGVRNLGTALQLVRKEFKGSAETATGLRSLMTALTQNAQKFKAAGVNVFRTDANGVKHLKDFHQIIGLIGASKLAKDPTRLTKAFGSSEALRAYQALTSVAGEWDNIYEASQDAGAVARDFGTYMASDAGRIDKAMNELKLTIAEAFTPERIKAFVGAIELLAQKLGPVVDAIGSISDKIFATYGVGQAITGYLSDNGNPFSDQGQYSQAIATVGMQGMNMFGGDNSDAAVAKRMRQAQATIADHDQWAAAANDIVGAQVDDRTTPESIRRAMAHTYHVKRGIGQGDVAENQAGALYLQQAGIKLPDQVTTQVGLKVQIAIITEAIKAGFAAAQTNVHVGADKVATAARAGASRSHPGGR